MRPEVTVDWGSTTSFTSSSPKTRQTTFMENIAFKIYYPLLQSQNEYIRGTAQVGKFGEKTREARLRWYGHLRRKDDGYIGRRMLRMELPGKRKRGRPKRRFMDVVKEDMAEVEVTEEDTVDRRNWRKKIRCGDP